MERRLVPRVYGTTLLLLKGKFRNAARLAPAGLAFMGSFDMSNEFQNRMEGAANVRPQNESFLDQMTSTAQDALSEVRQAAQRHPIWFIGTVAAFALVAVAIVKREALIDRVRRRWR